MQVGRDCWRIERADQMAVIVDAEDYFRIVRQAMLGARRRIMLIGWDFDARVVLDPRADQRAEQQEGPAAIGAFIPWLVERTPELEVFVLRWDLGALKTLLRGTTFFRLLTWLWRRRIHTRLDAHHPTGASHHQKIVVIDDCLAFCGGIDVTIERWDTREHRDDEPLRIAPSGKAYQPWHDATSAVSGPVAAALGELARDRWHDAGGRAIAAVDATGSCWPAGLDPELCDVDVGIARTIPELPDQQPVHECEALFLSQIANVKRWLYIESQYFASRRIAEAVARRLAEPDGPEFVIVNPIIAHGWLEPIAMDTARARLMATLGARDPHGRLRMYHPYTANGTAIYCHAKILVADDEVLRLGSSNMNNRSLRLDTECDLAVHASNDRQRARIVGVRNSLLGEHLGVEPERVAAIVEETGSLIAAVERLRGPGRSLRPYEIPKLNGLQEWLADNEVLDPEGPGEMFESLSRRRGGLFRRLPRLNR